MANQFFIEGTFRLIVLAGDDPLPAAPVEYQIRISDPPVCEASAGAADYVEANDGEDSRGNDVVTVTFGQDSGARLTGNENDAPEPTAISLTAGATVHLAGISADVGSDGDSYLDRDTFEVGIGAGVNEIDVRLSWIGADVDMDLMVFPKDDVSFDSELADTLGALATPDDEFVTVRVPPGVSDLWLWAATFNNGPNDLPTDYSITICPRTFVP